MQLLKLSKKNGRKNQRDQTQKKMDSMQKTQKIIVEIKVWFKAVMLKLKATEYYIFMEMHWKYWQDQNSMMLLKKCI